MKILKVLKRNLKKSIALFLCLTLIFSNSLASLANTNLDDPNTETSESIVEDIEEGIDEEEQLEDEQEKLEEDEVSEEQEELEEPESEEDVEEYGEEPEEDIEEEANDELGEENAEENSEELSEENQTEESNDESEENQQNELENNDIEETTTETVEEETEATTEEETTEETEEVEDIEEATPSELEKLDENLFNMPLMAPAMLGTPVPNDVEAKFSVNGSGSYTLYEAMEAIYDTGGTVKCISQGTCIGFTVVANNNVVIDFNNIHVDFAEYDDSFFYVYGGSLTIKNLSGFTWDTDLNLYYPFYIEEGGKLILDNVTLQQSTGTYLIAIAVINTTGGVQDLILNNVYLEGGLAGMGLIAINGQTPNVKITNSKFKYVDKFIGPSTTANPGNINIVSGKFKNDETDKIAMKTELETYVGAGNVKDSTDANYDFEIVSTPTPPTPTPTPTPSHGGGSGGGGGGSGRPVYDNVGNIIRPGSEPNYNNGLKVLTGIKQNVIINENSQLVDWNKNTHTSEIKPIIFVNETKKFLDTSTNRTITNDWVGVVNANGNTNWYYTNNDGSLVQSQLFQVGNAVFCFGDDGVMLTGKVQIGNEIYYFNDVRGAGEGAFIRKEPVNV